MGPPDTQGYSFNAYYFFKKISIYNHIHVSVLKNKKYHLRLFTTSPRPFSRWTEQPKNQSTGRPILVLPLGHSVSLKPSLNLNPTHERSTGSSRGQRRRVPAGSGYAGVGGGLAGGFGLAQGGPRIRGELRGDESGATCGGATMRTKRLPAHLKHPASGCSFEL